MMTSLDLSIPVECGAILLTGTALFPNSSMDLNIFEPRYKQMLNDALEDTWMFAVGNLISPEEEPYSECVSQIGTIALINQSKTLDDGRSLMVITGVYPVRFEEWIEDSPYPKARISLIERIEIEEQHAETIRDFLLDALPPLLDHLPEKVKTPVLENLKEITSVSALIDNVAHNFIADTDFRHELLCEVDDSIRASKLISALSQ